LADITNFQCPRCGGERIEMVEQCMLGSVLGAIDEEGHCEILSSGEVWDGETERFQCVKCGKVIHTEDGTVIQSIIELAEHARKRGWLEDE